jgi:hypothetical protein
VADKVVIMRDANPASEPCRLRLAREVALTPVYLHAAMNVDRSEGSFTP